MNKKYLIASIVFTLALLIGLGIFLGKEDEPSKENTDNVQNDAGSETNNDSVNDEHGNKEDVSNDEQTNSDTTFEKEKFYISEADVTFAEGFEYINDAYKEVLKDFARMSLLGYGGSDCLEDIKEINDRIFTEDSPNREDYINRMNTFESKISHSYACGNSIIELRDDIEKTNNSLHIKIRIVHQLEYHGSLEVGIHPTSVIYTITLIEKSGNVYIESCIPHSYNSFDGEYGNGTINRPAMNVEISDETMTFSDDFSTLSKEEQYVIYKFVEEWMLCYEVYDSIEEIQEINDEIFWSDSPDKEIYLRRIKRAKPYTLSKYGSLTSQTNIISVSGTEPEREIAISIDFYWWEPDKMWTTVAMFARLDYTFTLMEENGKIVIKSYETHEFNTFE